MSKLTVISATIGPIQNYYHFQVPHKHRDQRKVGAGKAEPVQGRHLVLHVLHKRRRRPTDGRRRGALQQGLEVKTSLSQKYILNLDDAAGITKRSEYGSPERLEWLLVKRQQATNAALTTSSMSTRGGR